MCYSGAISRTAGNLNTISESLCKIHINSSECRMLSMWWTSLLMRRPSKNNVLTYLDLFCQSQIASNRNPLYFWISTIMVLLLSLLLALILLLLGMVSLALPANSSVLLIQWVSCTWRCVFVATSKFFFASFCCWSWCSCCVRSETWIFLICPRLPVLRASFLHSACMCCYNYPPPQQYSSSQDEFCCDVHNAFCHICWHGCVLASRLIISMASLVAFKVLVLQLLLHLVMMPWIAPFAIGDGIVACCCMLQLCLVKCSCLVLS